MSPEDQFASSTASRPGSRPVPHQVTVRVRFWSSPSSTTSSGLVQRLVLHLVAVQVLRTSLVSLPHLDLDCARYSFGFGSASGTSLGLVPNLLPGLIVRLVLG